MTEKDPNRMWGGRFELSPAELMIEINASIGFDKALAPHDIRGSKAHAAMLAEQGIITKADARDIIRGLDQVLAEIEAARFAFSTQARGHPPQHREPADRADRTRRRPPAHGALAQRSGRARFPHVRARRARCLRRGAGRPAACARPQGRDACRHHHAGVHAPAAGAAGDLRPSSAGLCRDVRARPRPVRRCARAGSTRARSARRRWPARRFPSTGTPPRASWASTGRRPIRSTASPTATSRWRRWRRRRFRPCTCRGWPRRS